MISLKQNLYSVARFVKDLFVWCPESLTSLQGQIVQTLFPLIMDSCTEILSNLLSLVLEKHIGVPESDEFAAKGQLISKDIFFVVNSDKNECHNWHKICPHYTLGLILCE